MTDAPDSECLILFRVDSISEPRREKLAGEVGRPSSRSQKGRRCQLGYTPDTKAAWPYWEGGLSPGSIAHEKVYVGNGPNSFLCSWSNNSNSGERKQGDVRKVYNILGKEKTWRSR